MTIDSPCIGICEIDRDTGFCRGCCRTADEIAAWRDASPDVKQDILDRIFARRNGLAVDDGDS